MHPNRNGHSEFPQDVARMLCLVIQYTGRGKYAISGVLHICRDVFTRNANCILYRKIYYTSFPSLFPILSCDPSNCIHLSHITTQSGGDIPMQDNRGASPPTTTGRESGRRKRTLTRRQVGGFFAFLTFLAFSVI